jgi:hypothetical protein
VDYGTSTSECNTSPDSRDVLSVTTLTPLNHNNGNNHKDPPTSLLNNQLINNNRWLVLHLAGEVNKAMVAINRTTGEANRTTAVNNNNSNNNASPADAALDLQDLPDNLDRMEALEMTDNLVDPDSLDLTLWLLLHHLVADVLSAPLLKPDLPETPDLLDLPDNLALPERALRPDTEPAHLDLLDLLDLPETMASLEDPVNLELLDSSRKDLDLLDLPDHPAHQDSLVAQDNQEDKANLSQDLPDLQETMEHPERPATPVVLDKQEPAEILETVELAITAHHQEPHQAIKLQFQLLGNMSAEAHYRHYHIFVFAQFLLVWHKR